MAPTATPYNNSSIKEFREPLAKKPKTISEKSSKSLEPVQSIETKREEKENRDQLNRKYHKYKQPTFIKKWPRTSPVEEKKMLPDPRNFIIPKPTVPLPRPEELFTAVRKR